jgi:LEA14-like dessication related protein
MRKFLPLIITAGVAIAFYFFSKGQAAKNLKIYFRNVTAKWQRGNILPTIFAQFNIVNPSNTPLTLTSIAGDILINGQVVAAVSMLDKMTIQPNSTSVLNIKIDASAVSAGQVLFNIIRNKEKVKAAFEGTVNSGGVLIPISQSVNLI